MVIEDSLKALILIQINDNLLIMNNIISKIGTVADTQTADRLAPHNELQNGLTALGYTRRQVSIRRRRCGYSRCIDVMIRDTAVNVNKVQQVARQHEQISRDGWGELLEGGNTYITIFTLAAVEAAWAETYLPELPALINGLVGDQGQQTADGRFVLFLHGANMVKIWHEATDGWLGYPIGRLDLFCIALTLFKAAQP